MSTGTLHVVKLASGEESRFSVFNRYAAAVVVTCTERAAAVLTERRASLLQTQRSAAAERDAVLASAGLTWRQVRVRSESRVTFAASIDALEAAYAQHDIVRSCRDALEALDVDPAGFQFVDSWHVDEAAAHAAVQTTELLELGYDLQVRTDIETMQTTRRQVA